MGNFEVGIKNTINELTAANKPATVKKFICFLNSALLSAACNHKNDQVPNANQVPNPKGPTQVLVLNPAPILHHSIPLQTARANINHKILLVFTLSFFPNNKSAIHNTNPTIAPTIKNQFFAQSVPLAIIGKKYKGNKNIKRRR